MRKQWKKYMAIMAVTAMLVTGCGSTQSSSSTTTGTTTTAQTTTTSSTTTGTTIDNLTASTVVVDKEFTARDLEVGYEESTATQVTLNGSSIEVSSQNGVTVKGSTLTITDEGTYVISGNLTDGQIIVAAEDSDKVQIVLNGVDITCSDNAPIYIKSADKVFITLEENSENSLTDGSEYVQSDDNNVDAVIYSAADLTLNGDGILNITGNYKHGIASKDDLIITGGTYNITAVKDALNGKDCVKIKDGTFNLTVTDGNGIQSKNADDTTKGYVYICGGVINVLNSQEGIEGTAIILEDGTIDITAQDDGINAASASSTTTDASTNTDTSASTMSTTSTDTVQAENLSTTTSSSDTATADTASTTTDTTTDQFAKGGFGGGGGGMMENDANCYISITGGTITVNASGDGIDSNGSIYISGGTTYVSGPSDSGNAGMDYNGTSNITGGTIVVAGSSGMAQGFSDTSTQYSLLNNFTTGIAAGTEVTLTDKDGNVIVSYTPDKQYQSVVISTPDLAKDATYTLTCGDQTADLTLSSIVTSNGEQAMNGQGGGMGGHSGPRGQGGTPPTDQSTTDGTDTTDTTTTN